MKIVFNAINCGLGNNGGSQTIVQSANTLTKLGHDVTIVDSGRNQHTWHKLIAKHEQMKTLEQCPECDVIIGTGIKTFKDVVEYNKNVKKYHWIRGWETWQLSTPDMITLFKNNPSVKLLTNGTSIQKLLKNYDISSQIQLAGLDNCDVLSTHSYKKKSQLCIGGLINLKHLTKNSEWLIKIHKYLSSFLDVKLYTFGMHEFKTPNIFFHSHIVNPNHKVKQSIYQKVDFWFAPSINEGFHIPPAEYMLTGGVTIGVSAPLNGTKQYLFNNKTGFYKKSWKDMAEIVLQNHENYNLLNEIGNNAQIYIKNKIGSRKQNMEKFIKILEK